MKTTRPAPAARNIPPESPARPFLARHPALVPALLIILAGAAVYANSLRGVFLFDDYGLIISNPALLHIPTVSRILKDDRPVVFATFALNYAWSASNPWSYHLVNVAVHLLAALTLFGIVRRTLQSPALAGRYGPSAAPLALAIALLWTVHPLQTESVTYLIQRAESLMGLFYLLALYCLIRGDGSPHPNRWYAGAVASCLLGAGCKEVIVTLPALALAYDRLFLTGSWRVSLRRRWGLYLGLALCSGLMVLRFMLHAHDPSLTVGFGMKGVTPLQYALTQPGVILHYLLLSFQPWPLCLDYGWPLARSVRDALPALLAVGALLAVSFWGVLRGRRWGFPGLAFFCILAPTSSVVPIQDAACEHRMYLPLAAVMAAAVLAAAWCWNRAWPPASGRWSGRAIAGAGILAVAWLGFLTVRRNADYRDEVAFWEQTVGAAPLNARAYGSLGRALVRGEGWKSSPLAREKALRVLNRCIALDPNYFQAYYNRGIVYEAAQRYPEAVAEYDQALRLNPDEADVWFNRGTVCAKMGRTDEALRALTRAIALNPDYCQAYYNRGNVYADANRCEEAIRDYGKAIELKPDYADAWFNRANAYVAAGRPAEAISDFTRVIGLRPKDPDAYYNRAIARRRMKQESEAVADFLMARKLGATAPEDLLHSPGAAEPAPR